MVPTPQRVVPVPGVTRDPGMAARRARPLQGPFELSGYFRAAAHRPPTVQRRLLVPRGAQPAAQCLGARARRHHVWRRPDAKRTRPHLPVSPRVILAGLSSAEYNRPVCMATPSRSHATATAACAMSDTCIHGRPAIPAVAPATITYGGGPTPLGATTRDPGTANRAALSGRIRTCDLAAYRCAPRCPATPMLAGTPELALRKDQPAPGRRPSLFDARTHIACERDAGHTSPGS
jgi:hypothetical protein